MSDPRADGLPEGIDPERVIADHSLSMQRGNLIAVPITIGLFLLFVLLHQMAHGGQEVMMETFVEPPIWRTFGILAVGIVLHEALHGFAFRTIGGADRSKVSFGFHWKTFTPFAHCAAPLDAAAYRATVLLPCLVLGLVPLVAGLSTGIGWLSGWGALFVAAAAGDLLVVWTIRHVPGDALVIDHPSRIGCLVVGDRPTPST